MENKKDRDEKKTAKDMDTPAAQSNNNKIITMPLNDSDSALDFASKRKTFSKYPKSIIDDRVKVRVYHEPLHDQVSSEAGSGSDLMVSSVQDIRARKRKLSLSMQSVTSTTSTSTNTLSETSLGSSIHKFRDDFEDLKCKMRIFGESLNLCKCIASDFKGKFNFMERRLQGLEKRQKINRTESNYSAIIQKNKRLSLKTKEFVQKLQKCGTEAEMREVAGRICKNYLHGLWKVVEPTELQFRRISGGLSNFIYIVGLPENTTALYSRMETEDEAKSIKSGMDPIEEPKQVLLRIYGQVHGERAMDAIVTESVIFTLLSERRLGPKLFGVFSGGRIEEYIPGRSLDTKELSEPALSMKIAEKTAAIHCMDIPLSKEPNYIWKTMSKWLKTVKDECFNNGVKGKNENENKAIARLREVNFEHEIEWLKKFLATVDSPVVFCHNDLQEGNILLLEDVAPHTTDEFESGTYVQPYDMVDQEMAGLADENSRKSLVDDNEDSRVTDCQTSKAAFHRQNTNRESFMTSQYDDANTSDTILSHISDSGEPKLFLIDFEYCAYNFRAFDIANHFQEWAYDYTNPEYPFYHENQENWPTLEQKEIFIKEYLKHYRWNQGEDKNTLPDIDSVNKLLGEVDAFALASHLFWTLWSVVNANKSQIPFGYWEYGLCRLDTYLRLKQEVIKKDKFGLPQKRKIEEVDI